MPSFITLLSLMVSFSVSAKIYTWQDTQGVTHFSETKPQHKVTTLQVQRTTKNTSFSKTKKSLQTEQQSLISNDFLLGTWTGFNDREQSMQEWIFKEQGIFAIKQSSYNNFEMLFTGQWQLVQKVILLNGQLSTAEDTNNRDLPAVDKTVEIFEKDNNRLLVSFDDEEFWLERH